MMASELQHLSGSPRAAKTADAADIAACFADDSCDQDTAAPRNDQWERIVTEEIVSGRSQFFVVGSPVHSFVMMSSFWSPWRQCTIAQVGYVRVDPRHRRTGIGRALMQACEQHARSSGIARMELHVNEANSAAKDLYRSLGWRSDNPAYGGKPDIRYYKGLQVP